MERRGRGVEAPLRPHPESRRHGEGLRRARTRSAGARDGIAQPLRRQQRPGGRPVPRRSPARGRAQATARRCGKLSAAQGRPEFSPASEGTGQHRGPHPGRSPVLQRQHPRLPEQVRDVSEQPRGEPVRLQIRGRFLQRAAVRPRRAERGFRNVKQPGGEESDARYDCHHHPAAGGRSELHVVPPGGPRSETARRIGGTGAQIGKFLPPPSVAAAGLPRVVSGHLRVHGD